MYAEDSVVVADPEDWVVDEGQGEKAGAWGLHSQTWLRLVCNMRPSLLP